ncbi:MAG: TonB-dependent receptor [Gemmatimonadetes bacterium]|nr:TonB-dependent receptor [Gemmatimonadota bacterium]
MQPLFLVVSALLLQAPQKPDSARAARADTLERVTVRALRASGAAPLSERTISRDELQRGYAGQEAPLLPTRVPGITAYSESGSFTGYSYLRLRGLDQNRVNLSFDGIPLNDPEDQQFYFSNVPDFANSVQSVQVQRGTGTSAFGTASYAGSVNFQSLDLASAKRGGEMQLTGGAFDTRRAALQWRSGLTGGRWAMAARASSHQTDGFRAHSGNNASSGFLSAAWYGNKDVVKFTAFAGLSKLRSSYYAADEATVRADPRTNPMGLDERDRFSQVFWNLQHVRAVGEHAVWTTTIYRQGAGGWFDVKVDPDLWRFNLSYNWYGALSTYSYRRGAVAFDAGAHVMRYHRDHFLAIWPTLDSRVYDNTGYKGEQTAFAKVQVEQGRATWFADLQLRRAAFRYEPAVRTSPDPHAPPTTPSTDWGFLNPRIGLTWRQTPALSYFVSVGSVRREPTRDDMFAGADNLDDSNAASILPLDRVRPEHVVDYEAGATWSGPRLRVSANLFAMEFREEIAAVGALSLTGSPLRVNVGGSHRRGLEAEARWQASSTLMLDATIAVNDARINRYVDAESGDVHRNVRSRLSPRVVATQAVTWRLPRGFSLESEARQVSAAPLTNTGDASATLPSYVLADAGLTWARGGSSVGLRVNNVFDRLAFGGGYASGGTNYVFPFATRHVMVSVRRAF